MSSSHERERQAAASPPAPDVPRRVPRVSNQTAANGQGRQPGSHPAIREIHKNAWLKRLTAYEKKGTPFVKKCDKFWVVFCVHDDVEAFLEFYTEPKMAAAHKPVSALSLNNCLHVSPSIIGQDNEYQFAVTLQSQVIRLVAANWDQMIEWVESLQGKLREMNILSPKDNLYSKLPETKNHNFTNYPFISPGYGGVSTRDPNSPLPPPPLGYVSPVLGTEIFRTLAPPNRGEVDDNMFGVYVDATVRTPQDNPPISSRSVNPSDSNGGSANSTCKRSGDVVTISGPVVDSSSSSSVYINPTVSVNCSSRDASYSASGSESGSGGSVDYSRILVPVPAVRRSHGTVSVNVNVNVNGTGNHVTNLPPPPVPLHSTTGYSTYASGIPKGVNNTTVVTVSSGDEESKQILYALSSSSGSESSLLPIDNSGANSNPSSSLVSVSIHRQSGGNSSCGSLTNGCNPRNVSQVKSNAVNNLTNDNSSSSPSSSILQISSSASTSATVAARSASFERESSSSQSQRSSSSENAYEHLFVPENSVAASCRSTLTLGGNHSHAIRTNSNPLSGSTSVTPSSNKSHRNSNEECLPPVIPRRNPQAKRIQRGINTASKSPRSSSLSRLESASSGVAHGDPRVEETAVGDVAHSNGHQHRHRAGRQEAVRSFGGSPFQEIPSQFPVLQGRPMEAIIGVRSGEYRIRRDDSHIAGGNSVVFDGESASTSQSSQTQTRAQPGQINGAKHVPLKEQQVMRLRMEINHPGGVRVVLRKKDCVNSIAFVDFLGAVWIAGWKQQQHPVLYYAFHVGDQILKVAGVTVQTSVEANRAIKMVSSMQVEFIIRRLPFGRVLVLKRSKEGEPLGLIAEGNSGEIGDVVANGLAANHGLPRKGPATDGHSSCNWFLTEINNRPLSLMARDNEVKERLNAVGKEISILVQPADLVKHMRKNLKSLKGFKDYLVV